MGGHDCSAAAPCAPPVCHLLSLNLLTHLRIKLSIQQLTPLVDTTRSSMVNGSTANVERAGSDPTDLDDEERGLVIARCHVKTRKNAEQPINRLAPEVLSQIFVYFDSLQFVEKLEDALAASADKRKSLLQLCEVCVQWRRVSLSTPHLWNHILIQRPSDPFSLRSLTLSGTLPLVVYYFGHPKEKNGASDELDTFEAAMEHSHRLKELFIYGAWDEDCRYWKTLQREAPELKVLKILGSGRSFFQSPPMPKLFLGSTPSLEHLQLSIFSPFPENQFRNLRSLVLHDQDVRDVMTMGFSRFLCVLELSPQLEELVISRSGPPHNIPDSDVPLPQLSNNPVVLPNLRSLSLGCWLHSTEDIVTLLSYIRIPDSAARHMFASSLCEWDASLVDFVREGRLDGSPPVRSIHKLQMIASSMIEGHHGLSLENDTLTFTSNIHPTIRAVLHTSGLLSEVKSFVFVASSHYPPAQGDLTLLFQSLPSLRYLTVSGLPKMILPRITRALGLLPPGSSAILPDVPPCPLLATIDFLYFSILGHFEDDFPRPSGLGPDDKVQVDGTPIYLLAQDRAKRGYPLKRVVVERCRQEHLPMIEKHVKDVLCVERGADWPLGHYERSILREEYKRTRGVRKQLTD